MIVLYLELNSRLGFTEVIISDQGREFVNKLNEEFMVLAGMIGNHTLVILSNQAQTTPISHK